MTDEEAFFVVVGIDKPTGDAVGSAGFDFAGLGTEYVRVSLLEITETYVVGTVHPT
jgi:hypothetical protein